MEGAPATLSPSALEWEAEEEEWEEEVLEGWGLSMEEQEEALEEG